MNISSKGLDLIKKYEGLYLKAYKCPAGVLTIGYGTTNYDKSITGLTIKENTIITKDKAEDMLKKSIAKKYEPKVNKYTNIYKFNQNQYDALVSFAYNIGSIDQLTNNGKKSISNISKDILLYDHAKGKKLKGLTRRREEEKKLFDTKVISNKNNKSSSIKCIVTVDYLNVRSGAGAGYKRVGLLKKNDIIYVNTICNGWGRLSNTSNWVNLKYVANYIVTADYLNVRSGAGVGYKRVGLLKKDSRLYIDRVSGDWGKIIDSSKKWINLKYCKKI